MIEQRCGLHNAELPFSRLSATPSFIRFVLHLLSDLPRFRDIYNRSVDDYRKVHGIRSRHHPVPNLAPDEAPFWIWREGETKRGRLQVKPSNQKLLLIGAGKPIEVAPDADRWPQGVKIRSRALITTMFARLALADLFIHGIGGGKYDEVTDAIIRDYWGITPPAYSVMSATLRLPLPAFAANRADVRKIRQKYRDLHSNPQRYLPAEMGAEKARLLANEPTGHRARKLWFRALQCATDALRPSVTAQLGSVSDQLHQANIQANANALRQRRDFSFLLYPEELLMKWLNELPNQGLIG